jgi:hypothetical protein
MEVQKFQGVNYKLEPCRSKTISKYLKELDGETEARYIQCQALAPVHLVVCARARGLMTVG